MRNADYGWNKVTMQRERLILMTPFEGTNIPVYISGVYLSEQDRTRKEWWWYPDQIMLIPAFVFDVVTAPIQLIIGLHALSKINSSRATSVPGPTLANRPIGAATNE